MSVLDCRQLQLRSLTAVKSTQAADIELLIEQLQTAQQQQQESSQLLAELEACIASQAAHISDLEQQDRVATRVLAGLKVASTGKAANIELLRAQLQDVQLQLQGTEEQLQAANQTSKQQQDQQQLEDLISLLEEQDHVNARVVAGLMANCAHEEAGVKLQTRRLQAAEVQLQGTEQKVAGLQQQLQESQRRAADLEARLQATHQAAKVSSEQLAVLECSNARLADKVAQLQEHLCKDNEIATCKACDLELLVQAAKKAEEEGKEQLQLVKQQAAGAAAELSATNAYLAAEVEQLKCSQHTWILKQQTATQQVQQLQGRLAALEGEQREAHVLRGQLEDAHSSTERFTQEVHQG